MRAFILFLIGLGLVFAGLYATTAQARDNTLFLRSKKPDAQVEQNNDQTRKSAPIVRQNRSTAQSRAAATPSTAVVPYSDPYAQPCTPKDMKAYAQIKRAMDKTFVFDDETLRSDKKLAKAAKDQEKAGLRFIDFLNDPKNGTAYVRLLGRCSSQINALNEN